MVHGIPTDERIIKEGDIVSLDAGVIYEGYHSDAARTVAVGEVSEEAKLLIERTRQSFIEGMKKAVAGNHLYLALFAAITHTSALPTMLYLVPGSKKLREEYIRRMLKVKIGLPLALCAVIDIILLIVQPMMIKGVILQLVTVFFMSYCVGITNDGLVWRNNASRAAYGQVSYFNGPITVFSVIASCVMIGICSSEITNVEFWVALVIYLIIYAPLSYALHKRWGGIREKLAVYELATKEETWDW